MFSPYKETYFLTPAEIEASISPKDATRTEWKEDPSGRNMFGQYENPGRVVTLPHKLTVRDMKKAYAAAARTLREKLRLPLNADKERTEEAFGSLEIRRAAAVQHAALEARQAYLQGILDRRRAAREALRGTGDSAAAA